MHQKLESAIQDILQDRSPRDNSQLREALEIIFQWPKITIEVNGIIYPVYIMPNETKFADTLIVAFLGLREIDVFQRKVYKTIGTISKHIESEDRLYSVDSVIDTLTVNGSVYDIIVFDGLKDLIHIEYPKELIEVKEISESSGEKIKPRLDARRDV